MKKIGKNFKILFLFCMLFSQFASPVAVFAEEVEKANQEVIKDYTISAVMSDDYKIKVVSANNNYVSSNSYLVDMLVSYVTEEGNTGSKHYYANVLGSEMNAGLEIKVDDEISNGEYSILVSVYDSSIYGISADVSSLVSLIDSSELEMIASCEFTKEVETEDNDSVEAVLVGVEKVNEVVDGEGTGVSDNNGTDMEEVQGEVAGDNEEVTTDDQKEISETTIEVVVAGASQLEEGSYVIGELDSSREVIIEVSSEDETEGSYYSYNINGSGETVLEDNSLTIDFALLLQGEYEIEFTLYDENNEVVSSKIITVSYGDYLNNVLADYFVVEENTTLDDLNNMIISLTVLSEEDKEVYSIVGLVSDYLTVTNDFGVVFDSEKMIASGIEGSVMNSKVIFTSDINSMFDDLFNYYVVDKDGMVIENETIVETGMSVVIEVMGKSYTYHLVCYGEVNGGYVDFSDVDDMVEFSIENTLMDELSKVASDVNKDGFVDVADVTSVVAKISGSEVSELTDSYTVSLVNEKSYNLGDKVVVYVNIEGFDFNSINGIEAMLNYDKSVLSLSSINSYDFKYGNLNFNNGKFLYVTDGSYVDYDGTLLAFTFKTVGAGEAVVSLENIKLASDGVIASGSDRVTTSIVVESLEEEKGTTAESTDSSSKVAKVNNTVSYYGDTYIKSLVIEGYDIDFSKYVYEYSISVGSDVDSLDISVLLNDSTSTYAIYGNSSFVEGENIVKVVVTASDNSTSTYTIKVNKAASEEVKADNSGTSDDASEVEEETESNNMVKTVVIILIILVIIGLLYLIFKDDEEEEAVEEVKKNKSKK